MTAFDEVMAYCLSLEGAHDRRPFGPETPVMSVKEKTMFCLIAEDAIPLRISLKCDPMEAELLRAAFDAIIPGYHFNKRHWNTLTLDGTIPPDEVRRQIHNSYLLALGRKKEVTPLTIT